MKRFLIVPPLLLLSASIFAQSLDTIKLEEVVIKELYAKPTIKRLDSIQGTYIYAGKKSEVINLAGLDANVAEKTARLIFAKVPGVFVYDMDGSGNQINISTRGLDPHRGWEFNIRRDGMLTNSDMYGYPASHYSMPMESIGSIELVRGTGALSYGAQFGGMLNYITKQPDTTKKIGFETINTAGAFGLLSTYNALGGKVGKLTYYAYYQKRVSNGYRDNGRSESDAQLVSLQYEPNANLSLKISWSRSKYLYQLPGALTDSMFNENPRQATRSRNYYSPDIHVPSLSIDWKITERSRISITSSAVLGQRSSVMFDRPANVLDTINTTTLDYNPRQVDIDNYNSYTTEIRFLQQYRLIGQTSSLTGGVQYMNNNMHRRQLGVGTTGSDYDLTITDVGWGRDMRFRTQNVAIFIENNFKFHPTLSVNVGARIEMGQSKLTGKAVYLPSDNIPPTTIKHQFPLLGGSIDYKPHKNHNVYAGFSQAYRPVLLKDIFPGSVYERTNENLKDAYGYNAEIGYRGNWMFLSWDVTGFLLRYNNRMGTVALTDSAGGLIIYKTNIGNSFTKGIELFTEANFKVADKVYVTIFTSTSIMDARYHDAEIRNGSSNTDVSGNKVESVPNWISRNGITLKYWKLSFTAQYSYVSESYADALNTLVPNSTASAGLVPSYGLLDLQLSGQITNKIVVKINLNNATNRQYFAKRPQFYPGPGVWSSDGIGFSASLGIKI